MIKLNLLPSYIAEFRRMKIWGIIFVVLFMLEAGVFLGWQSGLKQQTQWFKDDQARCEGLTKQFQEYKQGAEALKTNAATYDQWLKPFWDLGPFRDYTTAIGDAMVDAALKLGGDGSVYKSFDINADGSGKLTASGKIDGSLRFLNYYFRMEDLSFDLKPAVPVGRLNMKGITLDVTGKVSKPLPSTLPPLPGMSTDYPGLFTPAGSSSGSAPTVPAVSPPAPMTPGGGTPPGSPGGIPPGTPGPGTAPVAPPVR